MKIKALIATLALAFITAVSFVQPASAGNGTNNYYLSGSCSTPFPGVGMTLRATNWDYGSNQKYHLATSRSGVAYIIDAVYLGGVYRGKGIMDAIFTVGGHGRYTLELKGHLIGGGTQSCRFIL